MAGPGGDKWFVKDHLKIFQRWCFSLRSKPYNFWCHQGQQYIWISKAAVDVGCLVPTSHVFLECSRVSFRLDKHGNWRVCHGQSHLNSLVQRHRQARRHQHPMCCQRPEPPDQRCLGSEIDGSPLSCSPPPSPSAASSQSPGSFSAPWRSVRWKTGVQNLLGEGGGRGCTRPDGRMEAAGGRWVTTCTDFLANKKSPGNKCVNRMSTKLL